MFSFSFFFFHTEKNVLRKSAIKCDDKLCVAFSGVWLLFTDGRQWDLKNATNSYSILIVTCLSQSAVQKVYVTNPSSP